MTEKSKPKNNAHVPAAPLFNKMLEDPEIRMLFEEERARTYLAMAVKQARLHAKLTQNALALRAGTRQSVIARIESGSDTRMPSMPLLSRIAHACGGVLEVGFKFGRTC
jgi:DNA-binding XRE family transcriptional regulator